MVPATDSASTCLKRWHCLGVMLLACLVAPGCAQIRAFRQPQEPAFGTDAASKVDKSNARGASNDLYADSLGAPRRAPGSLLTRRTKEPRPEKLAAHTETSPGPQIALQPPIPLSPASENRRELVARPSPAEKEVQTLSELPPAPADQPTQLAMNSTRLEPKRNTGPTIESILAETRRAVDRLTTYQLKMTHQERIAGTLNPPEDVILSIRRQPKAVRIEWPSGAHKGREVLYAADANGGLMHVNMGDSPIPIPRLSIPPDSPLALRSSRHPITEAGFDQVVQNMERCLADEKAGTEGRGKIRYAGLEKPDALSKPHYKLVRVTPAQETWVVYVDPSTHLPALVTESAANGDLVERFIFREPTLDLAELNNPMAFDPDARWGAPKGLLSRLARAAADNQKAAQTR